MTDATKALLIELDGIARDCDHHEYGLPLFHDLPMAALASAVEAAIRDAVAVERERCARVAETTPVFVGFHGEPNRTQFAVDNMRRLADRIAARIREGT